MNSYIETLPGFSNVLEVVNDSKASILITQGFISEILVIEDGQTLEAGTYQISVTTEKFPISVVELEKTSSSIEAKLATGITTIEPAISGLNGYTRLRDLTDVQIDWNLIEDGYVVQYDAVLDKFVPKLAGSSGSKLVTNKFTLTLENIQNKYVTLLYTPDDNESVELSAFGGIEQDYLVDYYILGKDIKWGGLALETLLDVGSKIVVRYNRA